jgi:hypothetical protein
MFNQELPTGGEVERHVRVSRQPRPDLGSVVGGQIVQHDVDLLTPVGFDRLLEERQEVRARAMRVAVADDLAGGGVQRGEQVRPGARRPATFGEPVR